jgi:ArsR family transcriptional regulator
MGHPLRFRILEYLEIHGETNVSALMDAMDQCQVCVSQSLKRLRRDDLVKDRRDGKFIYYAPCNESFGKLLRCIRGTYYFEHHGKEYKDKMPNAPLPDKFVSRISKKINFMGHPTRYKITEFLYANGASSVSEIMEDLNEEQVPISFHLKQMKKEGMVDCYRDGQFIFYNITSELPRTLIRCMHRNKAPQE